MMKRDRTHGAKCPRGGRPWSPLLGLVAATLIVTACQSTLLSPPRLATATAQGQATATATAAPLVLPAPTATAPAVERGAAATSVATVPSLTVWINETSPAHEAALTQMADEFSQERQIDVELRLVLPSLLPDLMETAVLSDTLPDVVLHPVEYTMGWAERGILDTTAANEIIDQIGRDTFDPDALALVTSGEETAAIPNDGYQQILLYRVDWFEERGLPTPDDYNAMLTAAETIFEPGSFVSGFVIPTESNLVTTHQAFEHIATANGCQLIDDKGEVLILEPACRQAIDFYYEIVHNYSPIGVQTDTSARNAFLEGRTGMIMSSPDILPKLAALDDEALPTCPECITDSGTANDYLARNSGIITRLTGPGSQATATNFGTLTYLGITTVADQDAAAVFADYWFNEGYQTWLVVEPERKVPMRWGTADEPRRFIDAWGTQPLSDGDLTLADVYGETVVEQLSSGVADSNRWGFDQGAGALMTKLYEELTLSVVLQEMLSGYFNSDQTIIEIYRRVTDLIPNYQYQIDLEPTATAEN